MVYIGMGSSCLLQVGAALIVLSQKDRTAFIYTNEIPVVNAVADVAFTFFFFQIVSGMNQTCRGVLAGCGKQALNAKISLSVAWLFGIPLT